MVQFFKDNINFCWQFDCSNKQNKRLRKIKGNIFQVILTSCKKIEKDINSEINFNTLCLRTWKYWFLYCLHEYFLKAFKIEHLKFFVAIDHQKNRMKLKSQVYTEEVCKLRQLWSPNQIVNNSKWDSNEFRWRFRS